MCNWVCVCVRDIRDEQPCFNQRSRVITGKALYITDSIIHVELHNKKLPIMATSTAR